MTTFSAVLVGYRAAKAAKRSERRESAAAGKLKTVAGRAADSCMIIAGLGLITAAAVLFNLEVGLVVGGLSLFALDFTMSDK